MLLRCTAAACYCTVAATVLSLHSGGCSHSMVQRRRPLSCLNAAPHILSALTQHKPATRAGGLRRAVSERGAPFCCGVHVREAVKKKQVRKPSAPAQATDAAHKSHSRVAHVRRQRRHSVPGQRQAVPRRCYSAWQDKGRQRQRQRRRQAKASNSSLTRTARQQACAGRGPRRGRARRRSVAVPCGGPGSRRPREESCAAHH